MKLMLLPAVCLITLFAPAQKIEVMVPHEPVAKGNAFQVQYVASGMADVKILTDPGFDSFTRASGPHLNKGFIFTNGKQEPVINITYTLVAIKTGKWKLGKLTLSSRNLASMQSPDAEIVVNDPSGQNFVAQSAYTDVSLYAPPRNAMNEVIKNNIWLKLSMSRQKVYVGEPVAVSFILYSRLQSSSELVKTPGFYGCSIVDMTSSLPAQGVENVQGKIYNTSLLRKLQLYPQQPGTITVEPMTVHSTIQFIDSGTRQQETVEKDMVSETQKLTVLPLPAKSPAGFTGAVGNFTLTVQLEENRLHAQQQGHLMVSISGSGNFIQCALPQPAWPASMLGFDPVIKEQLNAGEVPVKGKKTAIYPFTADTPGTYKIPPLVFSYFDPLQKKYITLRSDTLIFSVASLPLIKKQKEPAAKNSFKWLLLLPLLFLLLAGILSAKKKIVKEKIKDQPGEKSENIMTIDPVAVTKKNSPLQELEILSVESPDFFMALQQILQKAVNISNKPLSLQAHKEFDQIREDCSLSLYADLGTRVDREALKSRAINLLKHLIEAEK